MIQSNAFAKSNISCYMDQESKNNKKETVTIKLNYFYSKYLKTC